MTLDVLFPPPDAATAARLRLDEARADLDNASFRLAVARAGADKLAEPEAEAARAALALGAAEDAAAELNLI